jgi:hypothetical protein
MKEDENTSQSNADVHILNKLREDDRPILAYLVMTTPRIFRMRIFPDFL